MSEMLSGPDLGGGFLFQLTQGEESGRHVFTFHAQDGGSDAGGPPPGSPEPFGYAHPTSYCNFGGPRCWHREFELPAESLAKVRSAYNRTRFVMTAMLAQAYAGQTANVERALQEVIDRIATRARGVVARWWIGGSAALWIRGAPVQPHDIDIGASGQGVGQIADALEEYLIEPAARTSWPETSPRLAARAFVGTFQAGTRVEWSESTDDSPEEFGTFAGEQLAHVTWHGHEVPVARLEFTAASAVRRGDWTRIVTLSDVARRDRLDMKLLDGLLDRNNVSETARLHLRQLLQSS